MVGNNVTIPYRAVGIRSEHVKYFLIFVRVYLFYIKNAEDKQPS